MTHTDHRLAKLHSRMDFKICSLKAHSGKGSMKIALDHDQKTSRRESGAPKMGARCD